MRKNAGAALESCIKANPGHAVLAHAAGARGAVALLLLYAGERPAKPLASDPDPSVT